MVLFSKVICGAFDPFTKGAAFAALTHTAVDAEIPAGYA
jgi:hypothetical protein